MPRNVRHCVGSTVLCSAIEIPMSRVKSLKAFNDSRHSPNESAINNKSFNIFITIFTFYFCIGKYFNKSENLSKILHAEEHPIGKQRL